MTSREKVSRALDQLEELGDRADVAGTVRMALGALMLARPNLEGMLPADPGELDELLARGAVWFLSLRSDNAPAIAVGENTVYGQGDLVAHQQVQIERSADDDRQ